jgi:hypothetical protein
VKPAQVYNAPSSNVVTRGAVSQVKKPSKIKDYSDSLSKSESEEEMEFSDDLGSEFRVKNKD